TTRRPRASDAAQVSGNVSIGRTAGAVWVGCACDAVSCGCGAGAVPVAPTAHVISTLQISGNTASLPVQTHDLGRMTPSSSLAYAPVLCEQCFMRSRCVIAGRHHETGTSAPQAPGTALVWTWAHRNVPRPRLRERGTAM